MFRNYSKSLLKSLSFKTPSRAYTPRRAVLYVPGDTPKKIARALSLDVDCIVLDCEDGVALNQKKEARKCIRETLDKGKPKKKRLYDLAVRVNSINSGLSKDDMTEILSGPHLPDTILVPKIELPVQLKLFSDQLNGFVKTSGKIGIIIMIESALGLVNTVEICKTAVELANSGKIKPQALLFGSDDFCASIGTSRSVKNDHLIYARQKLVTVAKAFNMQAIDQVFINYKDPEGFVKDAEEGSHFGFSGKQVIHPDQIELAHTAFTPTKEKIEWATGLIEAFHGFQKKGKGSFEYKGQMIDMPTMKQALNLVQFANALNMRHQSNHNNKDKK